MKVLHRTILVVQFLSLAATSACGGATPTTAVPNTGAPTSAATAHPAPRKRASATAGPAGACITGSQAATYQAKVCITAPANASTLTKDATITATVTVTGKSPGIQHVAFYLDGKPLIEDFSHPYTFSMPTEQWVDGTHTLSAEAFLRDQYTTPQASISVTLKNGVMSPPQPTAQFHATAGAAPASGQPFVVGVVGDGAGGEPSEGQVVNLISSWNPNLFLYLGDVYERGTMAEFDNWYGASDGFGRFKAITDPTVGNHEYILGNDAGYKFYWNNAPDYYSYDAGGWHFISLDSNANKVGVDPSSQQYQWLKNDLAQNTSKCTAVYYHHPFFTIGKEGSTQALADIWKLMAQYHVSLVLNGHDHEYQRWTALDGNGQPDPSGMTEFVIGTGGHSLTPFVTSDGRVAFSLEKTFGALRLQLTPTSANFAYISASGSTADSGTVSCKG